MIGYHNTSSTALEPIAVVFKLEFVALPPIILRKIDFYHCSATKYSNTINAQERKKMNQNRNNLDLINQRFYCNYGDR